MDIMGCHFKTRGRNRQFLHRKDCESPLEFVLHKIHDSGMQTPPVFALFCSGAFDRTRSQQYRANQQQTDRAKRCRKNRRNIQTNQKKRRKSEHGVFVLKCPAKQQFRKIGQKIRDIAVNECNT